MPDRARGSDWLEQGIRCGAVRWVAVGVERGMRKHRSAGPLARAWHGRWRSEI